MTHIQKETDLERGNRVEVISLHAYGTVEYVG